MVLIGSSWFKERVAYFKVRLIMWNFKTISFSFSQWKQIAVVWCNVYERKVLIRGGKLILIW